VALAARFAGASHANIRLSNDDILATAFEELPDYAGSSRNRITRSLFLIVFDVHLGRFPGNALPAGGQMLGGGGCRLWG